MSSDPSCPFCAGVGQASDTIGDNEFTFRCVCSGGTKESVHGLLGFEGETPADEPEIT